MKTRTIFEAFLARRDQLEDRYMWHGERRKKMERQLDKSYDELLRRLDERDQLLAEKNERIARLNAVAAARPEIKPWSNDR